MAYVHASKMLLSILMSYILDFVRGHHGTTSFKNVYYSISISLVKYSSAFFFLENLFNIEHIDLLFMLDDVDDNLPLSRSLTSNGNTKYRRVSTVKVMTMSNDTLS